ncbi:MAG: hypothetical protein GXY36_17495 [Chloroflexi bacterium]|nr:hypothetical protein [Chloroflexota bacterium]
MYRRIRTWLGLAAGIILAAALALAYTHYRASAQDNLLTYGARVSGEVGGANASDQWQFEGVGGDLVAITITRVAGDLVPTVSLSGPDGMPLLSLNWPEQGPASLSFNATLQRDGIHTIQVGAHGGTRGGYALELRLTDTRPQVGVDAGRLVYGSTTNGAISHDVYRQLWTFQGGQGDVIDIRMSPAADLDASLSLITPGGVTLAASDSAGAGGGETLFALRLPLNGVYTVSARRAGDDFGEQGTTEGSYTLNLTLRTPGNPGAQPTPLGLSLGQAASGRLTTDAPAALYNLAAGVRVVSLGVALNDPTQIFTVQVMTPGRGVLETFSGAGSLRRTLTLPEGETVWLELAAPTLSAAQPLDFVLQADRLASGSSRSRALLIDRPQERPAEAVQEADGWHFAGQAGDQVRITVVPLGPAPGTMLRIYNPAGGLLAEQPVDSVTVQPLALTSSGMYEITISPSLAAQGYRIGVERQGAGLAFAQRPVPREAGRLRREAAGTLPADGGEAWLIEIDQAQSWHFDLAADGPDVRLGLAIEAPDGQTLATTLSDSRTGGAAILPVMLPHAGRYRAVVFDAGGTGGRYVLNGSPLAGGPLEPGVLSTGVLLPGRQGDSWSVNVPTASRLDVQVQPANDSARTLPFHVIGPDGALLASSLQRDLQNGYLSGLAAQQGGQYRVIVGPVENTERTVYTITVHAEAVTLSPSAALITPDDALLIDYSSTSTPTPAQIVIAEQIAPPFTADSPVLAAAAVLNQGALARGAIPDSRNMQAWWFQTEPGRVLTFSATALGVEAGPDLLLLDANGKLLAESLHPATHANYLSYRFTTLGRYYVVVRLPAGTRYTLNMRSLSGIDETLPTVLPGQAIVYGETGTGGLLTAESEQVYVFYGSVGDTLRISLARVQSETALRLTLAQATGGVLRSLVLPPDESSIRLDSYRLPDTGVYQLVVSAAGDEQFAPTRFAVHLNLESSLSPAARSGGVLRDTQTAELNAGSLRHQWLFQAQAGEAITVEVGPLSPALAATLMLQLTDSTGTVFLERAAQVGLDRLSLDDVLLPKSGVYQVIVSSLDRQSGPYRVNLLRGASANDDTHGGLRYGETVGRVLSRDNNLDVWTFAGSRGDEITIAARALRGDPAPVSFQLRTQTGEPLATILASYPDPALAQGIRLPVSGYYSIIVGSPDGTFDGSAAYALSVTLQQTPARSMGSLIDYGSTVTGALYADDPQDIWLFDGRQGDVIRMIAEGVTPDVLPALELLATDWRVASQENSLQVIASAQAVEQNPAQIDGFVLPVSGTYALLIEATAGASGRYRVSLDAQPAELIPAAVLEPGEEQPGAISPGAPINRWTFSGTRDSIITLTVMPDSRAVLAPAVILLGADGIPLASAEALPYQPATIDAYRLPVSGQYSVEVRSAVAASESVGRYSLLLHEIEEPPPALGSIIINQTARSAIGEGMLWQTWLLEAQAGDVVQFQVDITGGNLDPVLRVYGSDGALLAATDGQGPRASLTVALDTDGIYQVVIGRHAGAYGTTQGNYVLAANRVYRFAPAATGEPLAYGSSVSGSTDSNTRTATWLFSGARGDVIQARLRFGADDSPLALELQDAAGSTLTTGIRAQGTATIGSFTLPANGLYRLVVRRPADARANSYSPYSLALDLLSTPAADGIPGGVLLAGEPATAQITTRQAVHAWMFRGQAGQTAALAMSRLDGRLAGQLDLLAPDGSLLRSVSTDGASDRLSSGSVHLPLDGLYLVLITGDPAADFVYRLLLQTTTLDDTAPILEPFQAAHGTLNSANPQAAWQFQAQPGAVYALRVAVLSGDLQPEVTVWGPDGQPVAAGLPDTSAETTQIAVPPFTAPAEGRYTVTISRSGGVSGSTAGTYRLLLRHEPITAQAATAEDIAFGQAVQRTLPGPDTRQRFAFQGLAGDLIAIAVQTVDNSPPPVLLLETEVGTALEPVVIESEVEAAIPAFTLPQDGRYVLTLEGRAASEYILEVIRREASLPEGIRPRDLNREQDIADVLRSGAPATYWRVSGQRGDVLNFTLGMSSGSVRADLALYGPGGLMTSITQPAGEASVVLGPVRLPENGDYVLRVAPWISSLPGSASRYTLRVELAPPDASGSSGGFIPARDVPVFGGITGFDPEDVWEFDGEAGEVVVIRVETLTRAAPLALTVTGPETDEILTSSAGSQLGALIETPLLTLPSSGRYRVTISGTPNEEAAIEYRLVVLQRQTPHSSSLDNAHGIAYGSPQSGSLTLDRPYEAWVFDGQAGERITARAEATNSAVSITLLTPNGHTLQVARGTEQQVDLPLSMLPQDGFYALIVGPAGSTPAETDYTLHLERQAPTAVPQGRLENEAGGQFAIAAPVHTWTVQPAYSGDYLIEVVMQAPGSGANLFIYTAEGDLLASGVTTAPGTVRALAYLERDRTYSAIVSAGIEALASGSYRIRPLPASPVTLGGALEPGQTNIGRLEDAHFSDEWQVVGMAGQTLVIEIARASGDLLPVVSVLDPNQFLLRESAADNDGQLTAEIMLPANGRYSILVARQDLSAGTSAGEYTILTTLE